MGKYISKQFSKLNGKVYILARNEEKTLKSIEEIKKETNNNNIHYATVSMSLSQMIP